MTKNFEMRRLSWVIWVVLKCKHMIQFGERPKEFDYSREGSVILKPEPGMVRPGVRVILNMEEARNRFSFVCSTRNEPCLNLELGLLRFISYS